MKFLLASLLLTISLTGLADDNEEPELAKMMGQMQTFSHKTYLSIQAGNFPLANFYLHELEETIEEVEHVKEYDSHPVGQLTKTMLLPSFENLEKSVKSKNKKEAKANFDAMLNVCNACHQATEHGFIKIQLNNQNPYMQSFEVTNP